MPELLSSNQRVSLRRAAKWLFLGLLASDVSLHVVSFLTPIVVGAIGPGGAESTQRLREWLPVVRLVQVPFLVLAAVGAMLLRSAWGRARPGRLGEVASFFATGAVVLGCTVLVVARVSRVALDAPLPFPGVGYVGDVLFNGPALLALVWLRRLRWRVLGMLALVATAYDLLVVPTLRADDMADVAIALGPIALGTLAAWTVMAKLAHAAVPVETSPTRREPADG